MLMNEGEGAMATTPPSEPQPPTQEGGGTPNPLLQKYEEYSQALAKNPHDFQTWTYLLGTVERLDDMGKFVEVFDVFLMEYPLCYGYWKKYADAALKHLGLEGATTVYERGLAAVPYSVDLWGHYVTFRMTKSSDTPDMIRSLFERGLAFVGTDFLAHLLWDKYFAFEMEKEEIQRVCQLYNRVLSIPCKELENYHGKFVNFAAERTLRDVLGETQIETLKQQLLQKREKATDAETPVKAAEVDGDVQMQENGGTPQKTTPGGDAMEVDLTDEAVKKFWTQSMAELMDATATQLAFRRQYEDCIKRPYFHVKPLDNIQLQAWWKYLDAVQKEGDHRERVILFERCLVACAAYPEFWMRYILYMETVDAAEALNVLTRAVQVFCKTKSEMHLFAGHFYERRGDLQSARASLEHVTSTLAPSLLAGIVQHATFEYHHGQAENANQLYESKLQAELEKDASDAVGFLALQYAYVQLRRFSAASKAREVLDKALQARPDLLHVWEGAIQIEDLIQDEQSVDRVCQLYKACTSQKEGAKTLELQDRCVMSERYLSFLDLHGKAELYGQAQLHHVEQFGLCAVVPSLHRKRTEAPPVDSTPAKAPHGGEGAKSTPEGTAAAASAAMSDYFAQNPAAQQYAQYYQQYAAAAAAAGYGAYAGYGTSYTG